MTDSERHSARIHTHMYTIILTLTQQYNDMDTVTYAITYVTNQGKPGGRGMFLDLI